MIRRWCGASTPGGERNSGAALDHVRFSTIAHRDHVFCNPIGAEKLDRMLGLLDLTPGARVLDIGCGKGELMVRMMERYSVAAVGVDTNPHFVKEARARAAARVPKGTLELHERDFASFPVAPGSFVAAACIGSTHACGGYRQALRALRDAVCPGGHVLVGEGYWKRDPPPEYLTALDAGRDDYNDHAGNIAAAAAEGLIPLYATVSSDDDWDHYEGLYASAVERFVMEHPDDPDAEAMKERIRRWRDAYLRWGRETLGFGVYLCARG